MPRGEALGARHGVDPGQIVVGNGSVECIDLVARAFLRPVTAPGGERLVAALEELLS